MIGPINGGRSTTATVYHHLRHLKSFLTWLSDQPRYKSRVKPDAISYLTLDKKKVKEITASKPVNSPSLEYVRKLTDSIDIKTEIDRRDRAMIAFLLQSGMRDKAVITLPLGCFDPITFKIEQSPKYGVDVKFGKPVISRLLNFDDKLIKYVLEWADYLKNAKLFGDTAPLFPRSKVIQAPNSLSFESNEVEPVFWSSAGPLRQILKERATKAGLPYFYPHSYRHAAIKLATRRCCTPEQMKAVSQNFGHENIGTTLLTYGKIEQGRVDEVLDGIDFSSDSDQAVKDEQIDKMILELRRLKGSK